MTVSILHDKKLCPGTLTDTVHRLISMISNKNVTVKQGPKACVDKNHTVYLPPLPSDATERDFIRYFHLGTHEQAHIYGESDFDRASKDPVLFKLQNALEDIRCEELQEKEFPGLKQYRIRFYADALEDFANEEFINADRSDIKGFIRTIGKFIILVIRMKQLNAMHLKISPSDSLIKAYQDHIADLEDRLIKMSTKDEMFTLADIIYERLKNIIREEMQNKQQNKQQSKQEDKNDSQEQDSQDEEDTQTGDSSEEGSGDPEESTGNPSNDDSDAEPSEEGEDSSEKESEGSGESDSGDPSGDDSAADGDSSPDSSENEECGGDNPLTGDSDNEEDSGDSNDAPDSGSDTDNEDTTDDSNDNVHEGSDDSDDDDGNASDSSTDSDVSEDDESQSDDADGSGQSDSDTLVIDISKILDDLKNDDAPIDITTEIINAINADSNISKLPYMVNPNVKDVIEYGRETDDIKGAMIKDAGLNMLGPKGSQLTKIFVSQTKPTTRYNQLKGQFDIRAFATDIHDTRDDLYTNQTGARIDKAAITFLMDNSRSMLDMTPYTYALLSGILHHLSKACIPTEAIGYTIGDNKSSLWREAPAFLTIIKEFKEAYNGKVMRRCIPPNYMGLTNDLDGMKFAVPRLWARPEKKKIIIVLCDGKPYIGDPILTVKMQQAYKEYIEICRKAGIIIFGIGLGVNLSEYFGTDFVTVTGENVGEVLMIKLAEILNRRRV